MEKEEYKKIPEFVCVIDRSRSMYGKEKEIIEGEKINYENNYSN